MDKTLLISTLKSQHKILQSLLNGVFTEVQLPNPNIEIILDRLQQFNNLLVEHVQLENDNFYLNYLENETGKPEKKKIKEQFKQQMDVIAKQVVDFLAKYDDTTKISSNLSVLREDVETVTQILNLRVETEEEGLFDIYAASPTVN